MAAALNAALRQARGRFVCWLSSDDLFVETKLAVHRRGIDDAPGVRFFYSLPRKLMDETGLHVDPKRARLTPRPPWQVLEQMRKSFIAGNSVCLERQALLDNGDFDATYRYGQDYDAWLRLLARHPARLLPETTCVTRIHKHQMSQAFNEACHFDAGKSSIRFINRTPFKDWFPGLDLDRPEAAREAFRRALSLAGDERAYVYRLGPHPAVVNRLLEWLWREAPKDLRASLEGRVHRRAAHLSRRLPGTPFGLMWTAIAVATRGAQHPFTYRDVEPRDAGRLLHRTLRHPQSAATSERLGLYLERFDGVRLPPDPPGGTPQRPGWGLVIGGAEGDAPQGNGGARRDAVARLARDGYELLFPGGTDQPVQIADGGFAATALNDQEWERGLAGLHPFDVVVSGSRATRPGGLKLRRARAALRRGADLALHKVEKVRERYRRG